MSEITTAAELDALPYHSTAISIERYVVVQRCADGLWRTPGVTDAFTTTRLIDWGLAPLAVLWRPDRPAQPTVQPTIETLALHLQEYWARSARRREPIIWADLARDTLALIGEPTALPDLETLALVVHQGWQGYECMCGLDDLGPVERETATRIAGAVLDAIRAGEQP